MVKERKKNKRDQCKGYERVIDSVKQRRIHSKLRRSHGEGKKTEQEGPMYGYERVIVSAKSEENSLKHENFSW